MLSFIFISLQLLKLSLSLKAIDKISQMMEPQLFIKLEERHTMSVQINGQKLQSIKMHGLHSLKVFPNSKTILVLQAIFLPFTSFQENKKNLHQFKSIYLKQPPMLSLFLTLSDLETWAKNWQMEEEISKVPLNSSKELQENLQLSTV